MTYSQIILGGDQSFQWAGGGAKIHKICYTCAVLQIMDVSMLHHLRRLLLDNLLVEFYTLASSEV